MRCIVSVVVVKKEGGRRGKEQVGREGLQGFFHTRLGLVRDFFLAFAPLHTTSIQASRIPTNRALQTFNASSVYKQYLINSSMGDDK